MHAFAVVGAEAETGLRRLLGALDGRVGVVRDDGRPARDGGTAVARGDTEYVVGEEWRAAGDGLGVKDALDRLAPDHDYAAVVGVADLDVPLIAVGGAETDADRAGAIATFTGRVRERDGEDDDATRYLEFEKYDGVAERTMRTIESELEARSGVLDVRLHHRTGRVEAGEDIVFTVVLAGHREEAFRAVEDGIDRLKDEVPLFKKEVTESETFWVHQRE